MSLFASTRDGKTVYIISDFYVMILAFIISYLLTIYSKKAIERFKEYKRKKTIIKNGVSPRGGQIIDLDPTDSNALMRIIDECLENDKTYLVLNEKIKSWITFLVKENILNQSLVISPNFIKFLARHFIREDRLVVGRVSNIIIGLQNAPRFFFRVVGSILAGMAAASTASVTLGIFAIINMYMLTTPIPGCPKHFKEISSNSNSDEIEIFVANDRNNLIVSSEADKVVLYNPIVNTRKEKIIPKESGVKEIQIRQRYQKSKRPAKQVKFSDFKKTDPVLSKFDTLDEPEIKQSKNLFRVDPEIVRGIIDDL